MAGPAVAETSNITSDATASTNIVTTNAASTTSSTHFFDLPQEIRDMIYIYWPKIAWIDVAQSHPSPGAPVASDSVKNRLSSMRTARSGIEKSANQPNISKVCRRMREEALDVFYGQNKFLLDFRGWKHNDYPKTWTPFVIFEHWTNAMGDTNAGRIRSVSCLSHVFAVHVKIAVTEAGPAISCKFRAAHADPDKAENVPPGYKFDVAIERAEQGLRSLLREIEAQRRGTTLTAEDLKRLCMTIDLLQPFVCRRSGLGFQGAVLHTDDFHQWQAAAEHVDKCDECGYHRFTKR